MGPLSTIIIAISLLSAIGAVDYLSGSEISFSVFYFAPVGLLAWRLKFRLPALVMAGCCAVLWYVVDDLSGRVYSSAFIGLWNASLRLASLLIIASLVSTVRAARLHLEHTNRLLTAAIAEIQASSRKITDLQSQMQIVCAWTKRIRFEGKWLKFEEFMNKHLQLQFTHGISKEALAELTATISKPAEKPMPAPLGGQLPRAEPEVPSALASCGGGL